MPSVSRDSKDAKRPRRAAAQAGSGREVPFGATATAGQPQISATLKAFASPDIFAGVSSVDGRPGERGRVDSTTARTTKPTESWVISPPKPIPSRPFLAGTAFALTLP